MFINIGEYICDRSQVTIFKCGSKHESMLYNVFTFEVLNMIIPRDIAGTLPFLTQELFFAADLTYRADHFMPLCI